MLIFGLPIIPCPVIFTAIPVGLWAGMNPGKLRPFRGIPGAWSTLENAVVCVCVCAVAFELILEVGHPSGTAKGVLEVGHPDQSECTVNSLQSWPVRVF